MLKIVLCTWMTDLVSWSTTWFNSDFISRMQIQMQKKHLCTIFVTLSDTLKSNTVHPPITSFYRPSRSWRECDNLFAETLCMISLVLCSRETPTRHSTFQLFWISPVADIVPLCPFFLVLCILFTTFSLSHPTLPRFTGRDLRTKSA